jgi:hypothetical protein
MTRPRLDVADVIRSCYDEFLEKYGAGLTPAQRRALDDVTACRTAALGGHVNTCPVVVSHAAAATLARLAGSATEAKLGKANSDNQGIDR